MKRTRASWAMRGGAVALFAALALSGACSKQNSAPTAPPPASLPPEIAAVSPPSRARFVHFDAPIWAQFVAPLDPATVTPQNVFLKIDTQRLSCAVTWEAATQRIHITPLVALKLLQTYTVELSPNLHTAAGEALGKKLVWQFSTTSMRTPVVVAPLDHWLESPFVALKWAGNETTPGTLSYELYVAPDSIAVATRAIAPVAAQTTTSYFPKRRWHEFGPNYWSITVVNATVGERYDGPVWRWDTPGADVPVDTVLAPMPDFGWRNASLARDFRCGTDAIDLRFGANYVTGLAWTKNSSTNSHILAGARVDMIALPEYADSLPAGVSLWANTNTRWQPCQDFASRAATIDQGAGPLAMGRLIGPLAVRFDTDTLMCHFEQYRKRTDLFGYTPRAAKAVRVGSPASADSTTWPRVTLYLYRADPGPLPTSPSASRVAPSHARATRLPIRPVLEPRKPEHP